MKKMKKMKKTIVALACLGLAFVGIGAYQATATNTAKAAEENPDFACAGAGIRLDSNTEDADGNKTGIRFRVKMKTSLLEETMKDGGEVKIIVMPSDMIGADGVLDVNDTDAKIETLIDWQDFVNDDGTKDSTYKQAYAYVYGMTEGEYNRPTTWCAYYIDKATEQPVYTAQMERSLSQVALSLENDTTETLERRAMADDYILNYTITYDHGVRDEDGNWKTSTETVRYGTEIDELQPAPTTDAREDFEFLAWETSKGADKVREKDGKTIVTGNITKEAYWRLTGEIALDSANDVYKYADFSSKANTTVKENPTGNGVAFASAWGTQSGVEYVNLDWKNIVVDGDLHCRFKGYFASEKDDNGNRSSSIMDFKINDTISQDITTSALNNKGFDTFTTWDVSSFEEYGDSYYKLANFVVKGGNLAHTKQTATFEKFQIGAVEVIDEVKSGNNAKYEDNTWTWLKGAKGYNIVSNNFYTNVKTIVSDSYLACTATKVGNGNNPVMKVMVDGSSFSAGAKIIVKIKAQKDVRMTLTDGGFDNDNLTKVVGGTVDDAATAGSEFNTVIINVSKDISQWWLTFSGRAGQDVDFVIESIEVRPSTITTDVPQSLSGANEGAQNVILDNTSTVNQGMVTNADNVKYAFDSTTAWSGDAVTFNFKNIQLNPGDQIYLKAKGTATADIKVNGNSEYTLETGVTCDGAVFTASEAMTLSSLAFNVAGATSVDFTVYQLYIVRD